jgi:hypothetical protein
MESVQSVASSNVIFLQRGWILQAPSAVLQIGARSGVPVEKEQNSKEATRDCVDNLSYTETAG